MIADLILTHGRIRTQYPDRPLAEALALAGDRILAVGSKADAASVAGPGTRFIDLQDRLVLPGFIDSHFHYHQWALNRAHLDLSDAASLRELLESVRRDAATKEPGRWILGFRFNEGDWPESRIPTRRDLDAAAADHPVALWRCDLHLATANSAALAAAGIDGTTADPNRGVIDREADGRPSGILRERAIDLLKDALPAPGLPETAAAMEEGQAEIHRLGITGIHDMRLMGGREGAEALSAWQVLEQKGRLALRCWVSVAGEGLDEAVALGLRSGFGGERLRIGLVKFFADGGMGARTAWMLEPYRDAGGGMPLIPVAELQAAVEKADRAGLAVAIHAIGDRANREVVKIFRRVLRDRGSGHAGLHPAVRHRVEHLQMMRPGDISRLARLPVAACVQPANLPLDIDMIEDAVGHRAKFAYAIRDMMDAGLPVCFSSDCPVCDPDPLMGIHAAVTRCRPDGTPSGGWCALQKIRVDEAVRAYTRTPAEICGCGEELGSISPGKKADLVVLDRDIYCIDPQEIPRTRVAMTIFGGEIVYRSQALA